jgi:hypothetical protein
LVVESCSPVSFAIEIGLAIKGWAAPDPGLHGCVAEAGLRHPAGTPLRLLRVANSIPAGRVE